MSKFTSPAYTKDMPPEIKKLWSSFKLQWKKFIVKYVDCSNATMSAKYAEYSHHSARIQGCQLLTNPNIKRVIDWMTDYVISNSIDSSIMDKREIQQKLTRIARASHEDFLNKNGDIDVGKAIEIGSIEALSELTLSTTEENNLQVTTKKIKLYDPKGAIQELNKMQGNYEPETRNVNISETADLTDEELAEKLKELGINEELI